MTEVVGVGACVLDTVICCGEYPPEDGKYRAEQVFQTGGGPVGNALVALSRLGGSARYAGALSDDGNGKRLAEEFEIYGVKTEGVVFQKGARAFTSYIVLSRRSGSRTCIFERGSVSDNPRYIDERAIAAAKILHLDGNFLQCALFAAKCAKKHGVKVSLDAGGLYEGIGELLPCVDILIPSEEFALKFTGEKSTEGAMRALREKYAPEVLAVTQGAAGGMYFDGDTLKRYRGFPVDCVDSNGAGDTFHGAFLAQYLHGASVKECCEFASAASALKCTKAGVRNALPTREEVNAFLREREDLC